MSDLAKAKDIYKYGGSGVEAFLEWIMRSVKHGGVVILFYRMVFFSNHAKKKLKEKLKNSFFYRRFDFFYLSTLSFNTPKKNLHFNHS